tara:strand:+ start:4562 stop:5176 length:615 start_codon:yes stop_codon:yes gene_type:complete
MPRTNALVIKLDIAGERVPMHMNSLHKAMNKIGKRVVSNARKILKEQGKVVTGNLSKSLFYTIEGSKETIQLNFEGAVPYWDFVEQGVQGLISNKEAPKSPFKFGSGNFTGGGTLRGGIDRWVIQKPIGAIRDKKGRFIKRKQMVSAISSKIYNYGIAPSNYYAIALDQSYKKSKRLIGKAIGLDVATFVEQNMTGIYNIKITI